MHEKSTSIRQKPHRCERLRISEKYQLIGDELRDAMLLQLRRVVLLELRAREMLQQFRGGEQDGSGLLRPQVADDVLQYAALQHKERKN